MDKRITILGIGNILLTDDGFGVHAIKKIQSLYSFPENVSVIDGGVMGIALINIILDNDILIVIDAIKDKGEPGTIYRIEDHDIPSRIKAKNSLHQIDFLETLAKCAMLGTVPKTLLVGPEPKDIDTLNIELSPEIEAKIDPVINLVISELESIGVPIFFKKA